MNELVVKMVLLGLVTLAIVTPLALLLIPMTREAKRLKTREADNDRIHAQWHELLEYEKANGLLPTPPPSRGIGISGCSWAIPHPHQVRYFEMKDKGYIGDYKAE